MKFWDLFSMAWSNLKRRRSRTILTALGVAVGCCSIVIMVSIGEGIKLSNQRMLEQMADLTSITIYNWGGYGPDGEQIETVNLDDAAIEQIREIEGVKWATPIIDGGGSFSAESYAGNNDRFHTYWTPMLALDQDVMEQVLTLMDGSFHEPALPDEIPVLVGQYFEFNFMDTARPEGSNMIYMYDEMGNPVSIDDAYFNAQTTPVYLSIILNDGTSTLRKKLKVMGRVEEDYQIGYGTSQGIIMSTTEYNKLLKEIQRKNNEKSLGAPKYEQALVTVNSIQDVTPVEEAIHDLGFTQTNSMESMRKSMEESMRTTQLILGGIGAVSLLVAAIGITNTMMMSITERTREIGIMKALGCPIRDIRLIFLDEAAQIGLIGGIAGVIFSFIVSWILNSVAGSVFGGDTISYIPPWLALLGLGFSVGIGIISGLNPASKAVKIPAIEAIRHE